MRRALLLTLTVLMVIGGTVLRWQHLGAKFDHFDEVFPAALIARARATGNLDMNPRDAEVPPISRYNQYAGSSYHYAVLAWDTVMRVFPGWPHDNRIKPSLVRLRAFSALLATTALLLFAFAAWRITGPSGAFVATTLMALNPTLIQDAHYARPDAMLTLLVVSFAWLVGHTSQPTLRRAVAAGVVLGVLVAAKNTMGLLAFLPLLWLFDERLPANNAPTGRRQAARIVAVLFATAGVSFLATEPGVFLHFRDFLEGVARLQTQYSHPFPIHGTTDGSATYGMAASYFVATLGFGTIGLALAGVWVWLREREWRRALVWAAPVFVYAAYFGSKTIFFERAYSTFLPGVFLACGVAVTACTRRSRSTLVVLVLTAIAAAPGTLITLRFVGDVLSGDAAARVADYDHALKAAAPNVPVVTTPLWHSPHVEELAQRWNQTRVPFLVKIADYGDAWTRRTYTGLLQRVPARELQIMPGPFHGFPVSTLQTYHTPTWRYVWIGEKEPPTLPAGPSATPNPQVLRALASPAWHYWTLAIALGLVPIFLAVHAWRGCGRSPLAADDTQGANPAPASAEVAWAFPLAIVLALLAFRWPALFHQPELNVDEAQTIAGAITLQHEPLYWKSVDGTTHGPLNDFVLLAPRLFGWSVSLVTARAVGLALIAGALISLWAGARALWGEAAARVAMLPPLAFFALSTFWDFVHYSSEHLTLLLLSMGWALAMIAHTASGPAALRRWLLAGLALGAVPWAKLQGVPVAAVLALISIALLRRSRTEPGEKWQPALALSSFFAGLLGPSLLVLLYVWAMNLFPDFWAAYVVNNLRYATQTKMFTVWQMVSSMPAWTRDAEGFAPYVLGLLAFAIVALVMIRKTGWRHVVVALLVLAISVYAAVAPGRKFFHYLLLTIIPLAAVAAAVLAAAVKGRKPSQGWLVLMLFLGCTLGPQLAAKLSRAQPFLGDAAAPNRPLSAVSAEILRHARVGEPLGIWGYMPRYWVETGLPQAAREGHNERQVLPHPQLAYYRDRYLADLRRSRPPVMVDAVGPGAFWLENRAQYGHETWPELAGWIAENYRLTADVNGARIYVDTNIQHPTLNVEWTKSQ